VTNYADRAMSGTLLLHIGADFADVFEVRGTKRAQRGTILPSEISADGLVLRYQGLDGVLRSTYIESEPMPDQVESGYLGFLIQVGPQDSQSFLVRIGCERRAPRAITLVKAREELAAAIHDIGGNACRIETSNEQFNSWLGRSYSDLFMMITKTPSGLYPYAGVPWYSTVFGRDGIITALECLWILPELAKGVLRFLAAHQSDKSDPHRDAQPGKILHEIRHGEMAALDEIPFGKYYGSVDSTPLFVLLAYAYYVRTGDRLLMKQLWPNIARALEWITKYGDADGDGFVEYQREREDGLVHQGWKDSRDAVFHADGSPDSPPIALCEVQAYVYAALLGAAPIAEDLGRKEVARELVGKAADLRRTFHERFWMEDMGTFALAIDGYKQPCRVRASNAGQCLFSGIAEPWQAERVARSLLDPPHFSGWGIRTLDSRERRYNPMSYHNGSIWPHDNALIAAGFARYSLHDAVNHVLGSIFDVSIFMEMNRLPELICGFPRRRAQGPTLYPVACSPQVWAAASVFCLLQACMAMRIDALSNRVVFDRPVLPAFLQQVRLYGLRVGDTTLDLRLDRVGEDVAFHVSRKDGDAEVVVLK
jgi:glycogen debranching enzyme